MPVVEGESELVERARCGDRAAFGELFARNEGQVRGVVARYLRDPSAREELVQRAALRALEAISGFRGESAFSTWVCRIAINLVKNHLRDERPKQQVTLEEVELVTTALGTGKLVAREAMRKLAKAIEVLPPKQRTTVELRLLGELPFAEIAELTDTTEEAARQNYAHAVKRIRAALESPEPP